MSTSDFVARARRARAEAMRRWLAALRRGLMSLLGTYPMAVKPDWTAWRGE